MESTTQGSLELDLGDADASRGVGSNRIRDQAESTMMSLEETGEDELRRINMAVPANTQNDITNAEPIPITSNDSGIGRQTARVAAEDAESRVDNVGVGELQAAGLDTAVGDVAATINAPTATLDGNNDYDMEVDEHQVQGQEEEAENANACKICFTNLEPEAVLFLNCGCLYCAQCLNAHFRSGLANKASYPPRCCDQFPIDIEAIQGFLDDENMIRYTIVQEEFAANRPLYCANKECGIDFIGDAARIVLQSDERMVICYGCALETCARCRELREAHADNEGVLECPDSLALAEVKDIAEEQKWCRCPGCGFLVEKIDGCDHMTCDCRTEFHYVCGQEYGIDERCGCARNLGWGEIAELGEAADAGDFEYQLPPDVQEDLYRPRNFPFVFDEDTGDHLEFAIQNIIEGAESLFITPVAAESAVAAADTAQAGQEMVINREGRHDHEVPEVVEGAHQAVEIQEQEAGELRTDGIDGEGENDEDENLETADETLRTAVADFRNASERLQTAAAVVVRGRRRRAGRALRELQRANRDQGPRGRGRGRGGRGGRGRGG